MAEFEIRLDQEKRQLLEARNNRRFTMRCTEAKMHAAIDETLTVGALEALIKKHDFCDVCDLSGLSISTSHVLANCVASALYRYPHLRSRLCFLGSIKGMKKMADGLIAYDESTLKALGVRYICDKKFAEALGRLIYETIAPAGRGEGGTDTLAQSFLCMGIVDAVIMDEENFSKEMFLTIKRHLVENERSGHFPKNCNTIASVVYHELGHSLDYLCDIRSDGEIATRFACSAKGDIKNELSGYAATSVAEYVAEGFAEYMSSPMPRERAKEVVARIDKSYKTRFA